MYSPDQLSKYFTHISFREGKHEKLSLSYLTELLKRHRAKVPFENLSIHYSKTHLLSLDPSDLYTKIVDRGMGGYCMELNIFFGTVLRSLGYTLFYAGGRVSDTTAGIPGAGYAGWSHMVNIITIGQQRYLVDVGFGADGPTQPLPLVPGHVCSGISPQLLKLEYQRLWQHSDPSQRAWIYSHRANGDTPWTDAYSFVEVEFFVADYEVMNLCTMTSRQSFFTQVVLCVKTLLDEHGDTEGVLILFQNELKTKIRGETSIVEKLQSEEQRVRALEKWFGIILTEGEKKGIQELVTELKARS
ncbi:MAG: N-terminal acetyltransferase [Trichoglossum hirsutum]|nr:MAG: N-terminal acetyltransferase [Trichoglossum hirsutum]